ncbi:MAG: helix-turn-helix transcriptional regulator [Anaerolineales bacterium]
MASKHQGGRPSTHPEHTPHNGTRPDSRDSSADPNALPVEQKPQVYRVHPGETHFRVGEASVEYQPSLAFRLSSELSSRLLIAALARRWAPEALASWLLTRGLEQEPDRIRAEEAIRILTPRERDVTRLTSQGKTNHEIAYALGIARETVKSHIRSTLAKLGLHSKAELRLLVQTLDPELVQTLDPGPVQTLDPGPVQTLDPGLVQTLDRGHLQALEPWEGGSELKP